MNLKNKLAIGLGISVLVFNMCATAPISANEIDNVPDSNQDLRYTYIISAKSSLDISGGMASVHSIMSARMSVNKSLITSRLQRYENGQWVTVQAWTVSAEKDSCSLTKVASVMRGYDYRVFSTVKAYTASDSESIAIYSPVVTY